VHLIHGWQEKAAEPLDLEKLTINFEDEKPRKGKFQRFRPGPAPVFRWGHYGVTYPEGKYEEMFEWYTKTITLIPSDIVLRGDKPITCFFHIDRNTEYTDHHAFFFKMVKPGDKPNVAHAAFEVHDFDIQQLGHNHLTEKGYELCWGVGRVSCLLQIIGVTMSIANQLQHVLGSQVFDYWFDTSKFMVEHYADGDVVNRNTPVAKVQAGPEALFNQRNAFSHDSLPMCLCLSIEPSNSKVHEPACKLRTVACPPSISLFCRGFLIRPELIPDRFPDVEICQHNLAAVERIKDVNVGPRWGS
jgi:hypothetical protein